MSRFLKNGFLVVTIQILSTFCLTALPKEMPDDFYLEFHRDGGMRPDHTEIYFNKGVSHIKERKNGKEEVLYFRIDPALLRNLYDSVSENRFDRIGTRTETIYDRGGESVQVGAMGKTYSKSDSGMTLIQPFWRSNWRNVLEAVRNAKRSAVEGVSKIPFVLVWKDFKEPLSLQIDSEKRSVFYRYHVQSSLFQNVQFFFLPGKYKLEFEFHEDKTKFHKHSVEFDVTPDSDPLSLICSPEGCVRN